MTISIFLFLIIIALTLKNKEVIIDNFETVGLASLLLVVLSFLSGFLLAKLFKVTAAQVRTITFEVGLQNGTLALLITASIIKIPAMTLAALFYSLLMFVAGFIVIFLFNKGGSKEEVSTK